MFLTEAQENTFPQEISDKDPSNLPEEYALHNIQENKLDTGSKPMQKF